MCRVRPHPRRFQRHHREDALNAYLIIGLVGLAIVFAVFGWSICRINKTPEVKSHDAIAEELRRERLELYNTSLDYGALQIDPPIPGCKGPLYTAVRVREMCQAAFREGAKWQQRRP